MLRLLHPLLSVYVIVVVASEKDPSPSGLSQGAALFVTLSRDIPPLSSLVLDRDDGGDHRSERIFYFSLAY